MFRYLTGLWVMVLVALLAGAALCQGPPAPAGPPPPPAAPAWMPVPGIQAVQYAPNLQLDLFRHHGHYYYYHGGLWYQGMSFAGPWKQVRKVPSPFYQINAAYFHTPPGWAKGKKTGWKGAPLPPGQMKKFGGTP